MMTDVLIIGGQFVALWLLIIVHEMDVRDQNAVICGLKDRLVTLERRQDVERRQQRYTSAATYYDQLLASWMPKPTLIYQPPDKEEL